MWLSKLEEAWALIPKLKPVLEEAGYELRAISADPIPSDNKRTFIMFTVQTQKKCSIDVDDPIE